MKKIPSFAGCHVATHPKSGSCGSRGISLWVFFLFVLETSQYQSGLCSGELSCLSVLMVSTHRPVTYFLGLNFLMSMRSKNLVANPGSVLQMFRFSKLFVVSSTSWADASFRARDLIWALVPAALPQVAMHRSNMSLVKPSTSFGTSIFMLPKSLVTPSRCNDRCTHGMGIKLHTSSWSPSSVVTKQNDPAAAAYLCVSGVIVQCSSYVRK